MIIKTPITYRKKINEQHSLAFDIPDDELEVILNAFKEKS